MKKALGLRSSSNLGSKKGESSPSSGTGSGGKGKKPMTVGELMRVQMKVSESADSRIRRALLRVAAGQVCFSQHFLFNLYAYVMRYGIYETYNLEILRSLDVINCMCIEFS